MKFRKQLLAGIVAPLVMLSSGSALANGAGREINLSMDLPHYVILSGSAFTTQNISAGDVSEGDSITLGSMSVTSSSTNCDIDVDTTNDFELKSGTNSAATFSIKVDTTTFSANSDVAQNFACTALDNKTVTFEPGTPDFSVPAGTTYTDTVTIIVTNQ